MGPRILLVLLVSFVLLQPTLAQVNGEIQSSLDKSKLQYRHNGSWIELDMDSAVVGSCSGNAGRFRFSSPNYVYCKGGSEYVLKAASESQEPCSSAGKLEYVGLTGELRFCAEGTWRYLTASYGYFVQSSGGHNGNFSGLSGANSVCLSELTSNAWRGKAEAQARGLLTASKVTAFLCDSTSCQLLAASKRFLLADFILRSRAISPIGATGASAT